MLVFLFTILPIFDTANSAIPINNNKFGSVIRIIFLGLIATNHRKSFWKTCSIISIAKEQGKNREQEQELLRAVARQLDDLILAKTCINSRN